MKREFSFRSKRREKNHIRTTVEVENEEIAAEIIKAIRKVIRKRNHLSGHKMSFKIIVRVNEE